MTTMDASEIIALLEEPTDNRGPTRERIASWAASVLSGDNELISKNRVRNIPRRLSPFPYRVRYTVRAISGISTSGGSFWPATSRLLTASSGEYSWMRLVNRAALPGKRRYSVARDIPAWVARSSIDRAVSPWAPTSLNPVSKMRSLAPGSGSSSRASSRASRDSKAR